MDFSDPVVYHCCFVNKRRKKGFRLWGSHNGHIAYEASMSGAPLNCHFTDIDPFKLVKSD